MAVHVIEAKKPIVQNNTDREESRRLRVAAYCRVSTDSEEQETSYEAQCRHYTEYIEKNSDWELAGIYADEGISGTRAEKRPEFLKMIEACEAGQIDFIITKSISRWARNTLDSLNYIRKLKALGIAVLFEKENINTLDAKGELLITIMSSIAQQESQSISQNVRMGIQYQMQQGRGWVNTTRFLGFGPGVKTGDLTIIPEEADLVRRIYREFLEGYSPAMIGKHLEQDSIRTKAGAKKWHASTITNILENEKYAGDMLLQKYYTEDFLSHKISKNRGELPQYFVENHHAPIVPKEIYRQVQGELKRRGTLKEKAAKLRFGSEEALTGRIICGRCGKTLKKYVKPIRLDEYALVKAGEDGNLKSMTETEWRCQNRSYTKKTPGKNHPSPCGCRFVQEEEIRKAILDAINVLPERRDELLRKLGELESGEIRRIDSLLTRSDETVKTLEERIKQLKEQQEEQEKGQEPEVNRSERRFLEEMVQKEEETREKLLLERAEAVRCGVQIRTLLQLIDSMRKHSMGRTVAIKAPEDGSCSDVEEFYRLTQHILPEGILDKNGEMVRFDDAVIIRYLDHSTVQDDGLLVSFKAGISIPMMRFREFLRFR